MTRIVAIGECMVEMSPLPTPGQFRMGFAGDTLNTAWYLRRLLGQDHAVDYLTALGQDEISDKVTSFLADAGIGTRHIQRRADRTVGLYMIQLKDGERSFAYWRGQSAARTLAADPEHLQTALSGAHLAYFSGITIAILPEDDRTRLLSALQAFRAEGGQVIFDPNLRPRLWPDPAAMTEAIMRAAVAADIALPSFDDEAQWFGDATPEATADRYAGAGVRCIIVKNGAGRIVAREHGVQVLADPVAAVTVVDSTAAGDSFNAGFLAARLGGADLGASIAAGATLAARVIGQYGALVDVT